MHPLIAEIEKTSRKPKIPVVQSGDTVRVHQLIREGNKQRTQVFEGVVIRTRRLGSTSATITVRRIASGVGVEKTYLLHSPNVSKLEIIRRAKVRRNFLSYLRERRGKSARLQELSFDRAAVNDVSVPADEEAPAAADELEVPTEVTEEQAPADQKSEVSDADLTELDEEETEDVEPEVEVSTEELAKEENKEAAEAEPSASDGGTDEGDESVLENEEFEKGVDRAQPNNE
jgi:large subunit ribosomal protein L19